jgi:hypothetical protein
MTVSAGIVLLQSAAFTASANAMQTMPLSHTGSDGELSVTVTGSSLHVSGWTGSSTVTLLRKTQVDADFVEYNQDPNNGAGLTILNFYQEDLGTVRSINNVSAPASAINKNYPNGAFLCFESNAFMGRPCAEIEQ